MLENAGTPKIKQGEEDKAIDDKRSYNQRGPQFIRNNKGLPCMYKPIICQEGYCSACQIYLNHGKSES